MPGSKPPTSRTALTRKLTFAPQASSTPGRSGSVSSPRSSSEKAMPISGDIHSGGGSAHTGSIAPPIVATSEAAARHWPARFPSQPGAGIASSSTKATTSAPAAAIARFRALERPGAGSATQSRPSSAARASKAERCSAPTAFATTSPRPPPERIWAEISRRLGSTDGTGRLVQTATMIDGSSKGRDDDTPLFPSADQAQLGRALPVGSGRRALAKKLAGRMADAALTARSALKREGPQLDRAAAAAPERDILVLGIYTEDGAKAMAAAVRELGKSRHRVRISLGALGE